MCSLMATWLLYKEGWILRGIGSTYCLLVVRVGPGGCRCFGGRGGAEVGEGLRWGVFRARSEWLRN